MASFAGFSSGIQLLDFNQQKHYTSFIEICEQIIPHSGGTILTLCDQVLNN